MIKKVTKMFNILNFNVKDNRFLLLDYFAEQNELKAMSFKFIAHCDIHENDVTSLDIIIGRLTAGSHD